MAFHDLETLSAAAVQAVANCCEAQVTAEGQEQATPREQGLLHSLSPALLGQPWSGNCLPSVPPGLSGLVLTHRQRQEVMQLLTLLAFLEPRLDAAKVKLLQRIAAELQVEPGVVADQEEVCRGHVLKAFADMYDGPFGRSTTTEWRRATHASSCRCWGWASRWASSPTTPCDQSPGAVAVPDGHRRSLGGKRGAKTEGSARCSGLRPGAAATTGPIRDFQWDFWSWIDRPLADVRRDLNVLKASREKE